MSASAVEAGEGDEGGEGVGDEGGEGEGDEGGEGEGVEGGEGEEVEGGGGVGQTSMVTRSAQLMRRALVEGDATDAAATRRSTRSTAT